MCEKKMIFTTVDPLGRQVSLKENTWYEKILNINGENDDKKHGNSHCEMKDKLDVVKMSIESPNYIFNDLEIVGSDEEGNEIEKISDNREEFYAVYNDDTKDRLRGIKTIVEFDKEKGEIVTTHIVDKLSKISTKGGVKYDARKK